MKDRVPTYPGRVRLTPLGGNLYDLAMADEPSQVGTPLNKATLLTDATASLLGLSGDPTVDNALNSLSSRARIETISYVGTGETTQPLAEKTFTFSFSPILLLLFISGNTLASPRLMDSYDIVNTSPSVYDYRYHPAIITTSKLSESYPSDSNMFAFTNSTRYEKWFGKKSGNGKTITWYSQEVVSDTIYYGALANSTSYTYHLVGIGRGN